MSYENINMHLNSHIQGAVMAMKPCNFVPCRIIETSPLTIRTESGMDLPEEYFEFEDDIRAYIRYTDREFLLGQRLIAARKQGGQTYYVLGRAR